MVGRTARQRSAHGTITALIAATLVVAACAPIETEGQGSAGSGSSTEPVRGGTLTFIQAGDVATFDPTQLGQPRYAVLPQLYDTLINLDENLSPLPGLAEEWSFNEDRSELTLNLRHDVVFHDGSPFTAEDVVFNLNRYRSEEVGALIAPLLSAVDGVRTPDEYTVVLQFGEEPVSIFDALDLMYIGGPGSETDIASHPNGTGPFMLDSWTPGSGVTFVRNPDYWQEGRPFLDQVDIKVARDEQAAVVALESGAGDVVMRPQWNQLARLAEGKNLDTMVVPTAANALSLHINVDSPALADKRVRQAISMAINRDRVARTVLSDQVEPSCLPWSPGSPAYDEEQVLHGCDHDPEGARRLLDEAGFTDDVELSLVVQNGVTPEYLPSAEAMAEDLRQVGITVRIEPEEDAQAVERVLATDYDLFSKGYGRANRDPITAIMSTAAWRPEGATNYTSADYVELLDRGAAEADPEERKKIFHELNALILDEAFLLTLAPLPMSFAYASDIKGLSVTLDGMPLLAEVWLADRD